MARAEYHATTTRLMGASRDPRVASNPQRPKTHDKTMHAPDFGALRALLHGRPSAPRYQKICELLAALNDEAAQDYARAILDRAWPDEARLAHLLNLSWPAHRVAAALARRWELHDAPGAADWLRLPSPHTIILSPAQRRYGYNHDTLTIEPLCAALVERALRLDHLDLGRAPLDPATLPALLDLLDHAPPRRLSLDLTFSAHQDWSALIGSPTLRGVERLDLRLHSLALDELATTTAPKPCPALALELSDWPRNYYHEQGLTSPLDADVVAQLPQRGWALRAVRSVGRDVDDAALERLLELPDLNHLTLRWAPGERADALLARLATTTASVHLDCPATQQIEALVASGALALGRHTMALRFMDRYDEDYFDRLQRRYPPGALTCTPDTDHEWFQRPTAENGEAWYDQQVMAWVAEREARAGRALSPEGLFARTELALSGASGAHLAQALDEQTWIGGQRQRLRR
jgi:hypothetical protein